MPRHSPTRRTRRVHRYGEPDDPLDPVEGISDLNALEAGESTWMPARRDSRLPKWMPAPLQRLIRIGWRVGVVSFCLLLVLSLFYLAYSFKYDLHEITSMPERSVIYDMRGEELATLHGASRRLISREEIPEFLVEALQAREDKRFFDHSGVDLAGVARATLRNLKDFSFTQGASTLTMQLARNSFGLTERSLHRKLTEIALAVRIEWSYTKNEILTAYLNRIYFGSGCHGLDEAARRYFGVAASELNENQCALLVGIIRAPHACSPLRNLEGALTQRDEVLARMVAETFLTADEAAAIREMPLALRDPAQDGDSNAALQAVRRHFEEVLDHRKVHEGGLRLRTTIHGDIQQLLESSTADLLKGLPEELEVAAVCLNARTGGVRGVVGGRATERSSFSRALDARRDLGSVFTPFIYAAAAERGKQPLLDQPVSTGRAVGYDDLVRLAERLGFKGPFAAGDDLFRGGVSATPLEVVTAAATLTRSGNRPRPYFLEDLRDADLEPLFELKPSSTPVFEARATAAALAMQFPDGEPRLLTGTNAARTDIWAVSFGSLHTICLWLGYDQPRPFADPDAIEARSRSALKRIVLSISQ